MVTGVLTGVYRREGDWNLVELKLNNPAQLFNSLDPSPFRERDLDAEAAAYLVDAMRELHGHRHVKVVIYLPQPDDPAGGTIADAVHNFFRYREQAARLALRRVLRLGRASLLVGLLFLVACTLAWRFVFTGEDVVDHIFSEGFLIIGWVAMWRPLEILLYEWWPVLSDARLYARLAALPVEVRPRESSGLFDGQPGAAR
ncbi:MAG: hypothetical protein OEV88_10565 [Gammaproteobacteria bacterium]|jgi:hypothetical protein|nr:hypothetical protein [Gammaproteobacteria bacterium]